MPDENTNTTRAATPAKVGSTVSFTSISPPEQGDVLRGLTLAIAGVGPATAPELPTAPWPSHVGPADAWAIASSSDTNWYVLLSQDCDIVRDPTDEPTVLIAPLTLVDLDEWNNLNRGGYSARRFAYPREKFPDIADDKGLVVDLAWTTSIVKGSLVADSVKALRPLTGPNKSRFGEWLAHRTGRVPFPDDVVVNVLDPCADVRARLSKRFDRASGTGAAPLEARAVAAVQRWFAHRDNMRITMLGQLTASSLSAAGFIESATGDVDRESLSKASTKLEAEFVKKMTSTNPHSGYAIKVVLADLAQVPASEFVTFALLLR